MASSPRISLDYQNLNENQTNLHIQNSTLGDNTSEAPTSKNELSTTMGVFIPCILSILGAILYLRLSWAIGQVGYLGVLAILGLAGITVVLTTLSISAISTNGSMGGGGAYYMISRSIGPELGGAVGIVFYLVNAIGTTFHLMGFADAVVAVFFPHALVWTKILVATIALFGTLCAAMIGADFFSKLNALIFVLIYFSIAAAAVSLVMGHEFGCTEEFVSDNGFQGFTGISYSTFKENILGEIGRVRDETTNEIIPNAGYYDFFEVFGIIFPAMTGIMAGANMSGDLKDPGRSIGRGTLYAVISALSTYLGLGFIAAWTINTESLKLNKLALEAACCWPGGRYVILLGVACSTLSSALAQMVGAARVLQAVCVDFSISLDLYSFFGRFIMKALEFFSYGSPGTNEPKHGVVLTWSLVQMLLLLGSLDLLAALITNCFLLTYFFTNLACFVLEVSGTPNFRPTFRFYSWHTALVGAIMCITIMFLTSAVYAAISIIFMLLIFVAILYTAPTAQWGDVGQSLIYHQVRKYLLRLDEHNQIDAKSWRPSILLIVQDSRNSIGLIDFCNHLKKGGLYVLGDVVTGELETAAENCMKLQRLWSDFIPQADLKAFADVLLAPSFRLGAQTLMMSAGLGGMKPNTISMSMLEPENIPSNRGHIGSHHDSGSKANNASVSRDALKKLDDIGIFHERIGNLNTQDYQSKAEEFVKTIYDGLLINKNFLLGRHFHKLDKLAMLDRFKAKKKQTAKNEFLTIDIWITGDIGEDDLHSYAGVLSLMIQLAHGLKLSNIWVQCTRIRIVQVLYESSENVIDQASIEFHEKRMKDLLEVARLDAKRQVLVVQKQDSMIADCETINSLMRTHTERTAVIFMPLLPLISQTPLSYLENLHRLTDDLPPTMLVAPGKRQTLITTKI